MTAPPGPPGHDLAAWACHAGDVAFTVTAPAWWLPDQRAYLAGYLTAPPGELDLGAFTIRVHLGDPAFRQAAEAAAAAGPGTRVEPVPGLVLTEHALPGRRCFLVAEDGVEHQPGAWAVTTAGRHVDLYIPGVGSRPHRYPVRLIREAMLRTYEDAGGVVFHAAAADASGAGVMICGPGAAGKTTTLAALLRPGARLLSNDRVIAHHGDRLVAVPLPVPAARGTIEAFPGLARAARAAAGDSALDAMPPEFGSRVKHPFTAAQFAAALSAGLAPAAALRLVVIPRLSDSSEPGRLRRLPRAEARQLLAASCFTPRDEFWIRPWLVPRASPDHQLQDQAAAAVADIAARVACVELRFGVRAPAADLAAALDRALDGILP